MRNALAFYQMKRKPSEILSPAAAMKRKRTESVCSDLHLPEDCWERIFIFLNEDDDRDGDEEQNNRRHHHYLNSLSLVSKQFLSITNRHKSSLRIFHPTLPFLPHLFHRFTNLTSLDLSQIIHSDLNDLLIQLSRFTFNHLTSLDLSNHSTLPAIGLRAFSSKVATTLTSLTCSNLGFINITDDFKLISHCFPSLQHLNLSNPKEFKNYENLNLYLNLNHTFSLSFSKLRKINLSRHYYINDEFILHLFKNCNFLEEVIMLQCYCITTDGIASALRHRPNLTSLVVILNHTSERLICPMSVTSHFIDSLTSLKGLTYLDLEGWYISDHLLSCIAMERLPLRRLGLGHCTGYTYSGLLALLSNCPCIEHLNLESNDFLTDHHVDELSLFLGNLVSISLSSFYNYNYKWLTNSAIFSLIRNCPLLSEIRMPFMSIEENSLQNSNSLMDSVIYPQIKFLKLGSNDPLQDENIILYASIFPNLQFLNLSNCPHITEEGIGQVLRRCPKVRHLNLYNCQKLKSLGMNFELPKLEVLNLSNTSFNDEALYTISKRCRGLLQLSLRFCEGITKNGVIHVIKNCTKLREINLAHCPAVHASVVASMLFLRPSLRKIAPPPDFPFTDRNRKLFLLHGCSLF